MARISALFATWSQVESQSSAIIIARCGERTLPATGVIVINDTKSDSAIDIVAVLKGTNNVIRLRLLTDHDLQKGESYLILGNFDGDVCEAFEEYRVIPLGNNFHTNSIANSGRRLMSAGRMNTPEDSTAMVIRRTT